MVRTTLDERKQIECVTDKGQFGHIFLLSVTCRRKSDYAKCVGRKECILLSLEFNDNSI